MFTRPPALDCLSAPCCWRVAGVLGAALLVLGLGTACEDKAIGRPCDITVDASPVQGAYNANAAECPSHLCVKPAIQPGVATTLETSAYCTVRCASDTDCNGQERDPNIALDTRCRKGFTCAPVFDKGPLCCEKLCLCRDFFAASVGPAVPEACKADAGVTCS